MEEGRPSWTHLSNALWWRGLEVAGVRWLLSEPTNPLSVSGEMIPSYKTEVIQH